MIKRIKKREKEYIIAYHTQEFREYEKQLEAPILCKDHKAWLGKGYYFWTNIEFAHYWGEDFKIGRDKKGYYDIYSAEIDSENLLNTTFNEEHYSFFTECIDKAIKNIKAKTNRNPKIQEVHKFLTDNFWKKMNISGIVYDDLPQNKLNRTQSEILPLLYKKRIQIVVFDLKNIYNFTLLLEKQ